MLHARPLPASTRWSQTGSATEIEADSRRGAIGQVTAAIARLVIFVLGIACLAVALTALGLAQPREQGSEGRGVSAGSRSEEAAVAFDFANWPPLDLIDARANVAVFFRSGVPAEFRVAALAALQLTPPDERAALRHSQTSLAVSPSAPSSR